MEDLSVYGIIILKRIFENVGVRGYGLNSSGLRYGQMRGYNEHGNEPL